MVGRKIENMGGEGGVRSTVKPLGSRRRGLRWKKKGYYQYSGQKGKTLEYKKQDL